MHPEALDAPAFSSLTFLYPYCPYNVQRIPGSCREAEISAELLVPPYATFMTPSILHAANNNPCIYYTCEDVGGGGEDEEEENKNFRNRSLESIFKLAKKKKMIITLSRFMFEKFSSLEASEYNFAFILYKPTSCFRSDLDVDYVTAASGSRFSFTLYQKYGNRTEV